MWEFYISAFMELLTESSKTQTKKVGWIKISFCSKNKIICFVGDYIVYLFTNSIRIL